MSEKKYIKIHHDDNVAVALVTLPKDELISFSFGDTTKNSETNFLLKENIEAGHKFSLREIGLGESVIKYGYPIGAASKNISAGEHVHVHNLKTLLSESSTYSYDENLAKAKNAEWERENVLQNVPEIMAYKRTNGKVGIRNEVWIIPTVGCANKIAEKLAAWGNEKFCGGNPLPNEIGGLEGFFAWTHPYGCSQMGDDHAATKKILADLVNHPNAAAVLVLGLGCENNTVNEFKKEIGSYDSERVKFLIAQEVEDEIAAGKELLEQLANFAAGFKRQKVSLAEINIGMKCGGSDGLSGITANALVGRVCDAMAAMGAGVILTEVPEMFGAEQMLMNRCRDRNVFEKTVDLINGFKDYYVRHGQVVYENPSPGNKAGGITTLEDKSLGCVQKGGKAPVCDVLKYGQIISVKGLNLLEGPGNDIVSTTAMSAAGANIILFTTGRGTPLGSVVPTIKIASNHNLSVTKSGWIDFDASQILNTSSDDSRDDLLELICDVASGKKQTKNEKNCYREIAIFKNGVTL